jgi:hypothetical protein
VKAEESGVEEDVAENALNQSDKFLHVSSGFKDWDFQRVTVAATVATVATPRLPILQLLSLQQYITNASVEVG